MNSLDANYELLRAARELIKTMDRTFTSSTVPANQSYNQSYNHSVLPAIQRLRQAVANCK
jgi:hypothetical protein